ncbi:MAG: EAL domain-containing protein [Alphaproteobacteria bacterium]|nr:EAL domain-containing protein [Alphaproteobacteria bacterium]
MPASEITNRESQFLRFNAGDVILRQGEIGDNAYIIESGKVEISLQHPDGTAQVVGTRGPGAMIGEMALVDAAPRTATIRALEPCTLLELSRADFARRLESVDPVVRMTAQIILTRYRDTLKRTSFIYDTAYSGAESAELGYAGQGDALSQIKLANEFKTALESHHLKLHYQPIVDLNTRAVHGFEALMRWNHPERGFIRPDIFIPIAEQTGMIVEASRWALLEACRALKRIEGRAGYLNELFMSVNFSSADFASENFVETIYEIISKSDVDPHFVHLEITERLLIGQPEMAKQTLGLCRKAGMGISIDDFGTGYSSLSYLHHFPIDTLKIDRAFVSGMTKDEGALRLIQSIIALAKNMKMKIIAEGVEEEREAGMLRDLGCDMAQGYLFAKPMAEDDVTAFVAGKRTV